MKFLSLCSGIEAASVAFEPLGWEAVAFSEIEPFPCAVLAHHFPDVPNMGDMANFQQWPDSIFLEADIIVGGPPCFTSGHLVLTETGYIPIEEVKPGMMVMTHKGRMRRVLRTGSKKSSVGTLEAVGIGENLTVTPDHPFLAVNWHNQNTRRNGKYARIETFSDPDWIPASDMPSKQWCALTQYDETTQSIASRKFSEQEAMYLAGMYLGDGHIRHYNGKAKKCLVLSLTEKKIARMEKAISSFEGITLSHERTSIRLTINDTAFCNWLSENFGELSYLKRIPAWVMGHKYRNDLLRGYLDTDGCVTETKISASSTSRSLAYGICDLLNASEYVASVQFIKTPDTTIIEGRVVNQRDYYQVRAFHRNISRKSRLHHGYLLRTVSSFQNAGEAMVYNIEVDGDNSYVVNGVVVHNCQAFSVAGLRAGLNDARGNLTLTYFSLINYADEIRKKHGKHPVIALYENVPGILSDKTGAFGCLLAGLAGENEAIDIKKWPRAGVVDGGRRRVAWCVLDAQYFGVAQRRRRVFVVAVPGEFVERIGNRAHPAEILSIGHCLRGDTPSREQTRQVAPTIPARSTGGGGLGTDFDCDGGLVQVCPTLRAGGNKTGGDRPPGTDVDTADSLIPVAFSAKDYGGGQVAVAFAQNQLGEIRVGDVFNTINTNSNASGRNTPMPLAVAFAENSRAEIRLECGDGNRAGALTSGGGKPGQGVPMVAVTQPAGAFFSGQGAKAGSIAYNEHVSPTLKSSDSGTNRTPSAHVGMQVRRLTPVECERLQGFPDGWTAIPWRKKPASECPDGPRYKAIGNSWAVPVVAWIGRRIDAAMREAGSV